MLLGLAIPSLWVFNTQWFSQVFQRLRVQREVPKVRFISFWPASTRILFPVVLLCQAMWPQTATTSCDVNNDGSVNVVDVQLITNMEISAAGFTPCTANIGGVLGCGDSARLVVIKAALGQGCHFISLNWTASTSTGVTGYNIYRGTSPGGESSTPLNTAGPVSGTSFTDTTAVAGVTYYYFIKSTNGSAESSPSTEVSAAAL